MVHWNSSPHPISDIRDWSDNGRLELQPDFQRREVWSLTAKIMLMDTIIRDVPMPKIFLANELRDKKTYRVVIDGQQRISAILGFLRDEYALDAPYQGGDEQGKFFSDLDEALQSQILNYQIDFNEAINPTEEEIREVYTRVNKYTIPLTKQELRRADFPGDFLTQSEKLASLPFFENARLFTAATAKRYGDVEFVSELLAAMLEGMQDKKDSLDSFYIKYANWEKQSKKNTEELFLSTLEEINLIFNENFKIASTRFRQKADFYTLFLVVKDYLSQGKSVKGINVEPLRDDLQILDYHIRPESEVEICSEYAIKCVSQANSLSSRRWRYNFIATIMSGTYDSVIYDENKARIIYRLADGLEWAAMDPMCPDIEYECPICEYENISGNFQDCLLVWGTDSSSFQLYDSHWMHETCLDSVDPAEWVVLSRPAEDGHGEQGEQSSLF